MHRKWPSFLCAGMLVATSAWILPGGCSVELAPNENQGGGGPRDGTGDSGSFGSEYDGNLRGTGRGACQGSRSTLRLNQNNPDTCPTCGHFMWQCECDYEPNAVVVEVHT